MPPDFFEIAIAAVELILREEGLDGEIDIAIMDNNQIQKLNKSFRGMDKATDVLSFSYKKMIDTSLIGKKFNILGDVAISIETAKRNAEFYKKTLVKELCLLLIHGVLQVIGYSHESADIAEQRDFEQKQTYYEAKICSNW